jgi:putative pyruvate formate lyase activating enzyme
MSRPDAMAVLTDAKTIKSLHRYFEVMKDKLPARFLVCKRVPAKVDLSANEEAIWRAHERALVDFRKLLEDVDGSKTHLDDLEYKPPSLLDIKVELSRRILKSCHFCERKCGKNRTAGEVGICGVGERSRVASEFIHTGEEPELVPSYTIFFSGCTFKCQYCQNWDISQHPDSGIEVAPTTLSSLIGSNRLEGARNVNWVGGEPTPNIHNILAALNECSVNVPSVWNSNMYMSMEAMNLLSGTQDVYLTDFKYGNDACALKYSKVPNYWKMVTRNHKLTFADAELIIRHLLLPTHIECCTRPVLTWIAENLGPMVRVNVMGQYRPEYKAHEFMELRRHPTSEEMGEAFEIAREVGLKNVIG